MAPVMMPDRHSSGYLEREDVLAVIEYAAAVDQRELPLAPTSGKLWVGGSPCNMPEWASNQLTYRHGSSP
jgi:hypothetical protein